MVRPARTRSGAVGAPRGRPAAPLRIVVRALEGRELPRLRAGRRVDDVEIVVVGPVELRPAAAHERDRAPVRRPRGRRLVVVAGDEWRRGARRDIVEVEVVPLVADPAGLVLLELEAVDDDRRGRAGGRVALGLGGGIGIARRSARGASRPAPRRVATRRRADRSDAPPRRPPGRAARAGRPRARRRGRRERRA